MAQKSRPDPAGGNVVSADEYESISLAFAEDGVVGTPADSAVVYADSTGRQVKVRAGKTANVRGYQWFSDLTTDEVVGGLPANTSGLPRIDRLVLRLDRSARTVRVVHLAGTPASTPVAPSLTQNTSTSTGVFDFPLVRWTAINGYTTIAAADIVPEYWYPQPDGPTLCTSATRPFGVHRYTGMEIYETDTKRSWSWDGSYWVPPVGQIMLNTWLAVNVGSLDNGDRTYWSYNWTPPCPGTYQIIGVTPLDGVQNEEAMTVLSTNVGGTISDLDRKRERFGSNNYVNNITHEGIYTATNTSQISIYAHGFRNFGGSFYQSRTGNRIVRIVYLGASNFPNTNA